MKLVSSLADIPPFAAYMARIGAEPRSLRTAVVKEQHGKYWRDVATISLSAETGSITVRHRDGSDDKYKPTPDEEKAVKEAMKLYRFPTSKRVTHYTLPPELQAVDTENIFPFRDRDGSLIMLVVRTEKKDGDKVYKPWTFYEDDVWRCAEPDGKLPLWGLEHLDQNTTVFIHEGPKAARAMHRLIHPHTDEEHAALKRHPLRNEIQDCAHLGWHGGALNPMRTDWDVLRRAGVKHVYIVADNDAPGVEAIPLISKELRDMRVYALRFTKVFPASYDLADAWPQQFFKNDADVEHYVGPRFDSMLSPATWATNAYPPEGKKTKPIIVLRDEFTYQWRWCGEQDVYVNVDRPTMCYDQTVFDGMVKPFCDGGASPSALLKGVYNSQAYRMVYRPDQPERIINEEDAAVVVNMYVPPRIRSEPGNSQPWEDFLDYLFVQPAERQEAKRWMATLIARPEVRMTYSLLLISETQGMGKTTLGEHVLAPLVGMHNASFTNEHQIVESQFNSWLAKKRLIVVGEIYSGKSWKAYNRLKSYITDRTIEVNEKFMRPYTISNWAHFVCCSNSLRALKIEETDRRWFYPELNEFPWKQGQFAKFYDWLHSGGLNIIKHWAEQFGDYVLPGEHAPMTERKKQLIEESIPEPIRMLLSWCEAHGEQEMIVSDKMIKTWLASEKVDAQFLSPAELRKAMQKRGWKNPGFQISLDGILQYTMMSPTLYPKWNELNGAPEAQKRQWVRDKITPMIAASDRSF